MQAQEAVFIRGDDFYTNAMSRGDSTAIKQAVYAAQKVLVDSTTDELWSVQPVTDYTVGLMHTFPGGWSMEGKQKKDRPLLYFPHQRPNGDKGVVAILMAVELKANEPLYTNPKEPYIFQQWFIDGENRLGINIRKVAPKKKVEAAGGAVEGGDAVMEEAAVAVPGDLGWHTLDQLLRKFFALPNAKGFEGTVREFDREVQRLLPTDFAVAVARRAAKRSGKGDGGHIFHSRNMNVAVRDGHLVCEEKAWGRHTTPVSVWKVVA
jgi:hypothetical protein